MRRRALYTFARLRPPFNPLLPLAGGERLMTAVDCERILFCSEQEVSFPVCAIVRAGGRQEKVSVDDVVTIDRVAKEAGDTLNLEPLLVVDNGKVVSDAAELNKYQVTAEVLGEVTGPKIKILKYKSKTGYKRRLGHRQKYTQIRVTGIAAK